MNTGPILWLKGNHGWEIITENGNPKKEDLNKDLLDKGFTESELNTKSGDVFVWSKLITKKENDQDIIDTELKDDINEKKTELIVKLMIMAAIYEFMFMHKTPTKVVINEYLKVADFFVPETQKSFLNVILDKVSNISRHKVV